ncbi:hypothetical protein EWB00_007458 [Schistosoma japonicum]|uniref:Uncharacterized protein n=1 Tax=Schistosoma japonicum TaxID=6182 RepID=A0A4Z2CU84_SCHJA|nr:hypothetical protein EWB00_007458 [Schistosoma japonicum]
MFWLTSQNFIPMDRTSICSVNSNLAEFDQLTYNSYERETPKSISGLLSKVTLLFALLLPCTSKSIEKRSLIM